MYYLKFKIQHQGTDLIKISAKIKKKSGCKIEELSILQPLTATYLLSFIVIYRAYFPIYTMHITENQNIMNIQ